MSFRRNNCCCKNHPRPLCSCEVRECSQNEVVNPVVQSSFGFFNNQSTERYLSNQTIPLQLRLAQGSGIDPTSAGAVFLSTGTYQISYFAQGVIPSSGEIGIGLFLNGQELAGSRIAQSGQEGQTTGLSQTVVVTVLENSILEIVNKSDQSTIYNLASLSIGRI